MGERAGEWVSGWVDGWVDPPVFLPTTLVIEYSQLAGYFDMLTSTQGMSKATRSQFDCQRQDVKTTHVANLMG